MMATAPPPPGDLRAFDARAGSFLRGLLLAPLTLVWSILFAFLMPLASALTPGWFRRHGWSIPTNWGLVPLWWHGVKVEVTGREHADAPGAKVILFNHVSLLDLYLLAAHVPKPCVVIYKQEFGRVPALGRALRAMDMIPVDRKNLDRALASLRRAADRIRERGETVIMAPEGTRSRRGGLQRFKLGPFHLAAQTGAPIVPMVLRGIDQLMPMGSFFIRSGRIAIDFLPPIPTDDWDEAHIQDHAEAVREVFLRYLEPERPA